MNNSTFMNRKFIFLCDIGAFLNFLNHSSNCSKLTKFSFNLSAIFCYKSGSLNLRLRSASHRSNSRLPGVVR